MNLSSFDDIRRIRESLNRQFGPPGSGFPSNQQGLFMQAGDLLGPKIIESEHAVQSVMKCRQRKKRFDEWFWASLGYWEYTPIEFHEVKEPAIIRVLEPFGGYYLICHPSLAAELRRRLHGRR